MTSTMILEHMSLVVAALIFAILAGIPLGIICYFYPSTRKVILRVVDLIQTTPALALLGIIMVFMGAGKPTVIVGLALYSCCPLSATPAWGLDQVPEHLIEAGKGMGMTRMYRSSTWRFPLPPPSSSPASASPPSPPSEPQCSPPSWAAAGWAASSPPASARRT